MKVLSGSLVILCLCLNMFTLPSSRPAKADAGIDLVILPAATEVAVGDTFDLTVQVRTGSQEIDTLALFLTFDQKKLAVTSSATVNGEVFPYLIENIYSNVNGTSDSTVFTTEDFPSGDFMIAVLHFQAIEETVTPVTVGFNVEKTGMAREGLPQLYSVSTAAVSITPGIPDSITVKPVDATLTPGETRQFTANGTYSSGNWMDITGSVTWYSSDETIATIDETGLATGIKVGTVTITAEIEDVSDSAGCTVTEDSSVQDGEQDTIETVTTTENDEITQTVDSKSDTPVTETLEEDKDSTDTAGTATEKVMAKNEESSDTTQDSSGNTVLIIIGAVAAGVVLVIVGFSLFTRRRY